MEINEQYSEPEGDEQQQLLKAQADAAIFHEQFCPCNFCNERTKRVLETTAATMNLISDSFKKNFGINLFV